MSFFIPCFIGLCICVCIFVVGLFFGFVRGGIIGRFYKAPRLCWVLESAPRQPAAITANAARPRQTAKIGNPTIHRSPTRLADRPLVMGLP
jgi:hypothetical protein